MAFDSLTFLVFFLVVATAYWLMPSWHRQKTLLLAASYVFYSAWNPLFLPLLLTTSLLDWRLALGLEGATTPRARRGFLWAIITINLGVLGFFKYWNFFADNVNGLLLSTGASLPLQSDIALPIGISFYTFHSLSYCIDIYRGRISAVRSLRDYCLYIAFFPQLVAGPIVRWTTIGPQFESPRRFDLDNLGVGLLLMLVGLFEKIVLADRIFAAAADPLFAEGLALDGTGSWLAALAFAGQIFCDFAGYTTCALGAARVLGFTLPINFKAPYAALGFSDFWRRWHISLSTWLRDYLYISLGGNRGGRWLTYRNLMLTMLIGGLWHGAAWTFVVWGALHGAYLVVERTLLAWPLLESLLLRSPLRYGYRLVTFALVVLAWVYFRAPDLTTANHMVIAMLTDASPWVLAELSVASQWALATLFASVAVQWLMQHHTLQSVIERTPLLLQGLIAGVLLALIVLLPGEGNAFIYFQF